MIGRGGGDACDGSNVDGGDGARFCKNLTLNAALLDAPIQLIASVPQVPLHLEASATSAKDRPTILIRFSSVADI